MTVIISVVLSLLAVLNIILLVKVFSPQRETADIFAQRLDNTDKLLREEFGLNRKEMNDSARSARDELAKSLQAFETNFERVRASVEGKLKDIQNDNNAQLEQMRATVDEKLHKTLETRLGESFLLVSRQLEQVQKGLGEMQNLASDVGGLKKVLANVKTKGVLGEYQLGALLEQI
ncbi:DNA recombination protein RmuC, partial [Candidatus Termititenax persephonae]